MLSFRRPLLPGVLALLLAAPALAQQPAGGDATVSLQGVVVDGVTSGRVAGAVVSLEGRGQVTLTDSTGAFTLREVPLGARWIVVRALGYLDARVDVDVADPPAPVLARLSPDPMALEGIDVLTRQASQVTLAGVVVDDVSGAPLPAAVVSLPYQDRRSRTFSDARGSFSLTDVAIGPGLVLAEQVGYEDLLLSLRVTPSPAALELRLTPDSALLAGVAFMSRRIADRRGSIGITGRALGSEHLALSPWRDLHDVLRNENLVTFVPCARSAMPECVLGRRGAANIPQVYIDELRAWGGVDQLATYQPGELYLLEVYGRGSYIRAYTREFVEQTGRRPQALLPICWGC